MLPVLDPGHDLPLCCSITGKLIGNHDAGGPHLLLQQLSKEPLGSLLVASALDQYVKYHPALIDRTPEPMLLTRNRNCPGTPLACPGRPSRIRPVVELEGIWRRFSV